MKNKYNPERKDKFTFGLWTVGNPGADPFGLPTRAKVSPVEIVYGLADCGAYGVNLHDNDLVPFDANDSEKKKIIESFKKALNETGLKVPMATTNLFHHPVFKDGAFTSSNPEIRAFALQKSMKAIELGVDLGASTIVFWGGREGAETDAAKDPRDAIGWYRDSINFLSHWVTENGWDLNFALEAKPNEPRGDIYYPTTGSMLHFISTLDKPEMCGVNPEVAHENMTGLSMVFAVAQAMESNKLFHIDLNAQKIGRYDQDLRFGSEDLKGAFFLVRLLEGCGGYEKYTGPKHFDAHAYRTEDQDGVWDFAKGCMRTYKMLAEKAKSFNEDSEVQDILKKNHADNSGFSSILSYSPSNVKKIESADIDPALLSKAGKRYEQLDQIAIEHIMGVR